MTTNSEPAPRIGRKADLVRGVDEIDLPSIMLSPGSFRAAAGDGIEGVQVGLKKKPGGQLSISLGQGFTERTAPDRTIEYGAPACQPQTGHQQNGNNPSGWTFTDQRSATFTAKTGETKLVSMLNSAGSTDVFIQLKAKGIVDSAGPVTGPGTLLRDAIVEG